MVSTGYKLVWRLDGRSARPVAHSREMNRIVVADLCPYWTWPPTGGGPLRVHHLNRVVANRAQVLQFSARPTFGHRHGGWSNWVGSRACHITGRYQEYQYFHPAILGTGYLLYRSGLHSDLLLSPILQWLSPRQMHSALARASIIQVEHPWLFRLAREHAMGRPTIYVAHNVESALWQTSTHERVARFAGLACRARELEQEAVQQADAIVAMSAVDARTLTDEYGANPDHISIIPNGVDLSTRAVPTRGQKIAARKRVGLDKRPVLLFVGSDHYPNKQALRYILRWQAQLGRDLGVQFVVVGHVGQGVDSTEHMRITGFVEDARDYFLAADIALNPLTNGSGTSLKAVEYLAYGLPTITTETGVRGLKVAPGHDVLLGDVDEFPQLTARLVSDQSLQADLARSGRQFVERHYGWEQLGKRMLGMYERVC
jgi:glycosyltransferase involved in cell wall biosynthesis